MVRPSCLKSQEYPCITHPETEAISIDAASFPLVYSHLRNATSCPFDGLIICVFNEMRPPCQDDACLPRELRFAWLLRDDIRNGAAIDDPEAQKEFEIWWVLHGHEEYPAAARHLDPSCLTHLNDIISPAPAGELFPCDIDSGAGNRENRFARGQGLGSKAGLGITAAASGDYLRGS